MSKSHALRIFRAALKAADPDRAIQRHLRLKGEVLTVAGKRYRLHDFARIRVIGAGKATARMAQAIEQLLGQRITDGAINVPDGTSISLRTVVQQECGHPFPDERGVAGARRIAGIAASSGAGDLIICLISGGASALMPLPANQVTLDKKKEITKRLLASGASIHEINTVRKHLSSIKGGHLAQLALGATVISLILSDVIGDNLDVIGSGPTVPDPTTCADAEKVLRKYEIPIPALAETPKPGTSGFKHVQNVIVGSNRVSIDAAAAKARELGYRAIVLSTTIDGETRDVARMHAAIVRETIARGGHDVCFLSGGETTVTLRGSGLGGRNQEFVLAALHALQETPALSVPVTIFSAGTDGIDGPTDAAGAVVRTPKHTSPHVPGFGDLDPQSYLANNDSYHYFLKTGGLIQTGPTGTNVMDVRILLL